MKRKNLLLTLAMIPTMLLGIASVTSCDSGSTTRYNAQKVAVKRADAVGKDNTTGKADSVTFDESIFDSCSIFVDSINGNIDYELADLDPDNEIFSINSSNSQIIDINIANLFGSRISDYISDDEILILQFSVSQTIDVGNNSTTGGVISKLTSDDGGLYVYNLAISRSLYNAATLSLQCFDSPISELSAFFVGRIKPLKCSKLHYRFIDKDDTTDDNVSADPLVKYGNMTALGASMQLEKVFVDNDGQKFYFDPAKINVPTSKDGKKIVKFVSWKHFDAFRLNTTESYDYNPSDIELIETGDEIDIDYTTRYLIYPASITSKICLEAFISGVLTPCNSFFDEADPDVCLVKACRASNLEYEDQIKNGGTKTIVINVDSHYSEEDIISQVSAIDLFGVSVPVTKVSSDYVVGKTGKFNIVLSATDSYGQTSTATLICDVRDYSAPTITQKNAEIKYDYSTLLTEAKLLENFVLADNMGVDVLKTKFIYPTGFDISKALVFGSYNLTLEVTDAFNNKATKSFTLQVVDNVAPVISKKSGQIGDKIKISYSSINKNTINTILGYYSANDAIDGACDVYLKEGKIPAEMAGDFTLKIAAKDKSGNEAVYTVNCEIVADLPPVFILSDKLVNATVSNPLDLSDLQNIVQKAILRKSVRGLQVNAAGYLATPDKEGSYPVSYTYYDDNNEAQSGAFTLEVTDDTKAVETNSNWFVDAFKAVFKDTKNATATQWVIVIGTFVITLGLVGLIAYIVKRHKEDKRRSSSRRRNNSRRRW
mgnify:CR=1 FL=1